MRIIEDHIEEHIGRISLVYHEIVSDELHIDIHVVEPSETRKFYTLITSGMSDYPMQAPKGYEDYKYAELILSLPATWSLTDEALQHQINNWPITWLKTIARLPHDKNTWVSLGHTIPNGNPPMPFSTKTALCCWVLSVPLLFGKSFRNLTVDEQKTINFFCLIPIYREEMAFKLQKGAQPLIEKLLRNRINEVIDVSRKNVCKKLFGLF